MELFFFLLLKVLGKNSPYATYRVMKKATKETLLLISLLLPLHFLSAQVWKEMMYDPSVNIYDVVAEAEAYFQTVDKDAKGSGWKTYQRWLYENEPKFYPSGDRSKVDPYFVSNAYKGFLTKNPSTTRSLFTAGWEELGPYYIGQVSGHYSLGLGRVESFYADPNDTLRMYLGSRSGGFWKTVDGGLTWKGNTTDTLFATGVNTMTVSPFNSDSILINVRNARNGTTHGIYRSVDAGDTWAVTNFNPGNLGWGGLGTNRQVYQVAYHPTIRGLVFIGTNEGLYRSTDDLGTWTRPIATLDFRAIAFHPVNPNIIYATTSNNNAVIYISTNGGVTFTTSNTIVGNSASIKLSTTAACPNCVYIGTSDSIWKSTDQGQNFFPLPSPGLTNYGAFAVSDVDTNYMLFGNIDVNMSNNHGATFNRATVWSQGNVNYKTNNTYVHADIRGARCEDGVFWINTDGFLCKSKDNGVTWTRYEGQSIRENYNLGLSQSNHDRTICGSQDNGTSIKKENDWLEFYGADGMEGIIHPLNDDWMMGSVQYGSRRRTKDGGITQQGVTPQGQKGAWIAPLFYDPNDQMTVYHMGDTIYRSTDFGSNWTKLGTPSFSGTISYATIAENNSDIIVVTRSQRIEKSIDGGNTFTNIRGSLPNSSITDVVFDPNDDSVIVVTYGSYQNNNSKVYITTDQGLTWQNITHNLNNMPVRSAVIDHTDASTIYLGTEIGVYKKAMADNAWTLYNPGLPNVAILELEVMYGSNTLRAATWGRGLWEYTLDGRQDFPAILSTQITHPPTDSKPKAGVDQYVTSVITYDDSITSVYVEWSINSPVFGNVISMTNTVDSTWVSDTPIPNQMAGTKVYFKVFAVGSNGDTTETYKFMYEVKPFEYCQAMGTSSAGNLFIRTASISTMTNTSGNDAYTYYGGLPITLNRDSTYTIAIDANTGWNENDYAAWIDYNLNTSFDSDEVILYEIDSQGSASATFTVPSTARLNDTLILRVRLSYFGDNPDPCGNQLGEVEDYPVFIEPACRNAASMSTVSTCDSFRWNGAVYTTSGIYSHIITDMYGCDSTANLSLTILNNTGIDTQSACGSYTWIDGNTYTANNTTATHILTNAAGCDSVVTLNLTLNQPTASSSTISACDAYTWSANGNHYTSSGTYSATLTNTAGCDSVATLNLTINTINTAVSQTGLILTADEPGATYQWINCIDMMPISGATGQSYTTTFNGDFAVIIHKNGCIDTSACFSVRSVGIIENDFGSGFSVYPNPTDGRFSVALGAPYPSISITITDINGKLIQSGDYVNSRLLALAIDEAAGVYLLRIEAGEKRAEVRLVKE